MKSQIYELIKITEIATKTPYSAEYLSLRARQGKLKSEKVGNVWYTTRRYVNEYLATQEFKKSIANGPLTIAQPTHQESIVHEPSSIVKTPWLIKWVVIPLALVILTGFIPIEALHKSIVLSMAIVNDLSDDSSPSIKSQLTQTVGQPPKTPQPIADFFVYSRTMFLGLAASLAKPLTDFYQNHPLLMAASTSNFPELKNQIAQKYGPTSPSAIAFLAKSATTLLPTDSSGDGRDQVAGVTSERSQTVIGDDPNNIPARLIEIPGDKGIFAIKKGEVIIRLVSVNPITNFSIMPSRLLTNYRPRLRFINPSTIELQLTYPAKDDMEVLWRKL